MNNLHEYIDELLLLKQCQIELSEQITLLRRMMGKICEDLTKDAPIKIPNLFGQIVYICKEYTVSDKRRWELQHIRVQLNELERASEADVSIQTIHSWIDTLVLFCQDILDNQTSEATNDITAEDLQLPTNNNSHPQQVSYVRVELLARNSDTKRLTVMVDGDLEGTYDVRYDVEAVNKEFTDSVERFRMNTSLNLLDCVINDDREITPKYIVYIPDYLIDVSSIAECFQNYLVSSLHFFRQKFERIENRHYILLGNLANYFLDVLINAVNPDSVTFVDVFKESFKLSPFEYSTCEDIKQPSDFKLFMESAEKQFMNIKRVVKSDFHHLNIDNDSVILEPAFYSERFGFQGRLDVLAPSSDGKLQVVELKSGKLPYPSNNPTVIALNHQTQARVYQLMMESVYNIKRNKQKAAILYSAGTNPGENLRYVSELQQMEKTILNIRNHILANELELIQGDDNAVIQLFESLEVTTSTPTVPTFYYTQITGMLDVLKKSSTAERAYFYRFIRFNAYEMYLQKVGNFNVDSPSGTAALWNTSFQERCNALEVLHTLTLKEPYPTEDNRLIFNRNKDVNTISNFREGEICIVYPRNDDAASVLNTQILKGTIVSLTPQEVVVKLRYKQRNKALFDNNRMWAIEHDTLDSNSNNLYKNLFDFMQADKRIKQLYMGEIAPETTLSQPSAKGYPDNVIENAVGAKDYFLIVGPPGSGKTSIVARKLVETYFSNPDVNILLLAFTNRAVDELCDAVIKAFDVSPEACNAFIRLGSHLSCGEAYRHRLLQEIASKVSKRDELNKTIRDTRIFISTIASMSSNMELFKLKTFQIGIIDEASQVLDIQLIGILPKLEKTILIGDHNQLATIVLQPERASRIDNAELRELGFDNCRISLFERLISRCQQQGWTHAYTQLSKQGRMHTEIATFPATHFYDNSLHIACDWQTDHWTHVLPQSPTLFEQIANCRTAFISTSKLQSNQLDTKSNQHEAHLVAQLIEALQHNYFANNKTLCADNIGVITPYRNQIALIRHYLNKSSSISFANDIMIDTVERFQGSQRDIIIVSFCVNKAYQLDFLSNLTPDKRVDRKLNVTLTRARKQMFLIGNTALLSTNHIYRQLVNHYKDKTVEISDY